jgi:hypothetical protein
VKGKFNRVEGLCTKIEKGESRQGRDVYSLSADKYIKLRQERYVIYVAPDGSSDELFNVDAINITRLRR